MATDFSYGGQQIVASGPLSQVEKICLAMQELE